MSFVIAIPSHRRAQLLEATTLAWLHKTDIPLASVHVVVSDSEDAAAYAHLPVRIVQPPRPVLNVVEKFNAIHHAWPAGTNVCVIEDDVTLITGEPNKPRVVTEARAMVEAGFAALGPAGGLWGIAPHSNTFFFKPSVSRSLKLVVAHAFGFVATHDPALEVTQRGKSDYERTCRYFIRYGQVVRLDSIGVKTVSYTKAGGMQAELTREARAGTEAASCDWLVRKYPHLLEPNRKKKSLFDELRFKRCDMQADDLAHFQEVHNKVSNLPEQTEPTWTPGWITSI